MRINTPLALLLLLITLNAAWAGEAPQFRGPDRDGIFQEEGLLREWPEGGPELLWTATGIGAGYSSATVAGGKIHITGMTGDLDGMLSVLDLEGNPVRRVPYGKETDEAQAPGTRSTPTLDGDRLYLLTGPGVVCCIDPGTDLVLWRADLTERFGAKKPMWHFAESVLVDGNRVVCTPGTEDALLAALDRNTGETLWTTKGPKDTPSYCSPTIITHNGRRILTTATGRHIVGADPETGALLWTFEQKVPWDIHGVTPLYSPPAPPQAGGKDGLLYYVGGDGAGGGALALSPDGAEVSPVWTDTTLDCLHSGVVLLDGYLYGTGYKNDGRLVCLEMATGRVLWSTDEVTQGALVAADGMLFIYEGPKAGVVSLVKADPAGFTRTGKFTVTAGGRDKHWAHPAIADGRLYIRHGDTLSAYRIK